MLQQQLTANDECKPATSRRCDIRVTVLHSSPPAQTIINHDRSMQSRIKDHGKCMQNSSADH